MAKIVYATLSAHITPDHYVIKGDPYPVDHPAVVARPDCFTQPEPDPEPETKTETKPHDRHEHVAARAEPPRRGRPSGPRSKPKDTDSE